MMGVILIQLQPESWVKAIVGGGRSPESAVRWFR
jgi:hypothetical protein